VIGGPLHAAAHRLTLPVRCYLQRVERLNPQPNAAVPERLILAGHARSRMSACPRGLAVPMDSHPTLPGAGKRPLDDLPLLAILVDCGVGTCTSLVACTWSEERARWRLTS
jgi:hypothetical protein